MRIVQEILERSAAFSLTVVWFVAPFGFSLLRWPDLAPHYEIDASRAASSEERVVVWDLGSMTTPPPQGVEDGDGDALVDADATDAPSEPGPASTSSSGSSARRGTPGGGRMVRPGTASDEERAASTGKGRGRDCAETTDAIRDAGAGTWEIERSLIEWYADDHSRLDGIGWVQKHEDEQGKNDGFQVRGIRCGTVLHQAGLKNRDVVHTVNGRPVNNLLQAVAAYRRLRRDEVVVVELTRGGERVTQTYRLL
jgi:hypothetical protein